MKRLHRSMDDRMIAGVCSGLADYFDIDVVLVRLLWVLAVLLGGTGLLAYIIAWIIIPERNGANLIGEGDQGDDTINSEDSEGREKRHHIAGLILICLGLFFLFRNFFPWQIFKHLWPLAIIALGVFLLISSRKES